MKPCNLIKSLFLLALMMTFLIAFGRKSLATATSETECLDDLDLTHQQISKYLQTIESLYPRLSWTFDQYRELIYHDLWRPQSRLDIPYENNISAHEQVEHSAALHQAEILKEELKEYETDILEAAKQLRDLGLHIDLKCDSWRYQNCTRLWIRDYESISNDAFLLLQTLIEAQKKLNRLVENHQNESVSDHTAFGPRMSEPSSVLEFQLKPEFIEKWRTWKKWVGPVLLGLDCCQYCSDTEIEASKSEAEHLMELRKHDSKGVEGDVISYEEIHPLKAPEKINS